MKVLQLPVNIASQMQIFVKALQAAGVQARGLLGEKPSAINSSERLEVCYQAISDAPRFTPTWFRDRISGTVAALDAIRWADVVHYHFGTSSALPAFRDVVWARWLNRLRLINFWGSDIRINEIECLNNPYYERVYPFVDRWAAAKREDSERIQRFWSDQGFHCVIGSESMIAHIDRRSFPEYHLIRCAIDIEEFVPSYPDPEKHCPVLAHTPSDQLVKGTPAVLKAVEELRRRGCKFEFQLIQAPRAQALEMLRETDIFIDQLVLGGYGMSAIEAMAFGKPTVCYINPSIPYPKDLPIVNATMDNLADHLQQLIADGERRQELGRLGRVFAERYHAAGLAAGNLKALYTQLLSKRS